MIPDTLKIRVYSMFTFEKKEFGKSFVTQVHIDFRATRYRLLFFLISQLWGPINFPTTFFPNFWKLRN